MSEWGDEEEFDDVEVIAETDMALLCAIDRRECWIPKSQISDNSEIAGMGDEGTLIINGWFADKEKLR
jgi:hypothetical protein